MNSTSTDTPFGLASGDLLELGMAADAVRRRLHPGGVVTYALTAPAGLPLEQAAHQAATNGHGDVLLADVAGLAQLPLAGLEETLRATRARFPDVRYHQLPVDTLLTRHPAGLEPLILMRTAGVDSLLLGIPAGAATAEWLVHAGSLCRRAAELHMALTLVYTIGRGEAPEARENDLAAIRALQQETGAIECFVLRIQHAMTAEARREEEATAVDYLKTLAAVRLTLDSIPHLSAEWTVMGPKVLELALRFGADDAGFVAWSQQGTREPSHHGGEAELRRIIRDAGFRPVERDALFRQSLLR